MNVKLHPFLTPNHVIAVMPPRPRQEGWPPSGPPTWKLSEVEPETLSEMCDTFRAAIFAKAQKPDPHPPR